MRHFFIKWKAKHRRIYASLLFTALITYGMLLYSNAYMHYFLLATPLFSIAADAVGRGDCFVDLWRWIFFSFSHKERIHLYKNDTVAIILVCITSIYILLSVYSACAPIYKTYFTDISYNQYCIVEKGISVIPEGERDSIIAYQTLTSFYYHADIIPCYKYFTLQK